MEVHALPPEIIQDTVMLAAQPIAAQDIDKTFRSSTIDLISKPLGSRILAVSDEWFAEAANLTTPTPPITKPGVYTYAGAWFDGWESRRHNTAPADWVVLRLGTASGRVAGIEIDTGFFNGNHAPEIAVEGCYAESDEGVSRPEFDGWETILGKQECGPACRQAWKLAQLSQTVTHVRLLMYPDGGIGRFRLYGHAQPVFPADANAVFDLAAAVNGGVAVRCSDQHFGTKDNLLLPGRGVDMGDGWETKRSRGEHVDWVVVHLGAACEINKVVVDTAHFRGNFPQKVRIEAATGEKDPGDGEGAWTRITGDEKCGPDQEHELEADKLTGVKGQQYQWIRMTIIPDGGVKRLRVFGKRAA